MKRIEIDCKYYRYRREVLVEIPDKWIGNITTPPTINRRESKKTNKLSRETKRYNERYIKYMDNKLNYDEELI